MFVLACLRTRIQNVKFLCHPLKSASTVEHSARKFAWHDCEARLEPVTAVIYLGAYSYARCLSEIVPLDSMGIRNARPYYGHQNVTAHKNARTMQNGPCKEAKLDRKKQQMRPLRQDH